MRRSRMCTLDTSSSISGSSKAKMSATQMIEIKVLIRYLLSRSVSGSATGMSSAEEETQKRAVATSASATAWHLE